MIKNITFLFLAGFVFLSFSTGLKAENKLTAPLKAPFSIFNDKNDKAKDSAKENKDLNAQVEKNQKAEIKDTLKYKVYDPQNPVGIIYVENVIDKAEFYIEESDFDSAKQVLDGVSEWIYDATEYHTDLFKTLNNLENSEAQADIERNLAIQFAILRDKALFLESKVFLANGKKREAVKNLVEVVRSQPSTDLGFKAYETLQEIGFTYRVECKIINKNIE